MASVIENFKVTLVKSPVQLAQISEADSAVFPAPNKWSKKQILGHLIDSAANNHQRFVRVQLTDDLNLQGYAQNDWVTVQQYQKVAWRDLITLWQNYNQHILHIIAHIPAEKLAHKFQIEGGEKVTLGYWIEDYYNHLQHHLSQIFE